MVHRRLSKVLACTVLTLLAADLAGAAKAPSFKRRSENEKNFVAEVGEAVVKAAYRTAQNVRLVEYHYSNPKPNRTDLSIKMEYSGVISKKITKKKYAADIVVKLDSSDKNAWEVLRIIYRDNNTVPYSHERLEELIDEMNK